MEDDIEIPHPRANERAFVLVPWAAVQPEAFLPGLGGGSVSDLAENAPDRGGVRWLALDWRSTGKTAKGAEEAPAQEAAEDHVEQPEAEPEPRPAEHLPEHLAPEAPASAQEEPPSVSDAPPAPPTGEPVMAHMLPTSSLSRQSAFHGTEEPPTAAVPASEAAKLDSAEAGEEAEQPPHQTFAPEKPSFAPVHVPPPWLGHDDELKLGN
jgi:hypothetical protein